MAIVQQIDEVQGITDTKVSKILNQMRTIINDLTNRSGKKITALAGNADIGGVTNKVNEIIASLQGTNYVPPAGAVTTPSTSSSSSSGITTGTAVATTSGTAVDFTGIPATTKRITVMFNGVSTSGTSDILIQIGNGSIVSTGYA